MASKTTIENICIVGATGRLGSFITAELLRVGKFKVTAISRADSKSAVPEGVIVKKVDYEDKFSLEEAMQGQDVLVIIMGAMAPKDTEIKLVEAAAAAGVPWILPNEWSPDTQDKELAEEMLIGPPKVKVRERIRELGKSSFIVVSTSFWYEWSLGIETAFGFDFQSKKLILFDDGEMKINTSTWPQIGRAVASLLSLKVSSDSQEPCLGDYKNSWVYISSFLVSQRDMLDSVLRVTGAKIDEWTVEKESSLERYSKAKEQFQAGDWTKFGVALYTRVFFQDGKGNVEKRRGLLNNVLGLPEEEIDAATRIAIDRQLEGRSYG